MDAGFFNKAKLGKIDFANPDVINHLGRSYGGGLYTLFSQIVDMIYKVASGQGGKIKTRNTPLRGFFTSKDDMSVSPQGLNTIYWDIADETKEANRLFKGYLKQYGEGKIDKEVFERKKENLHLPKFRTLHGRIKRIQKLEKMIKDAEPEKQREMEQQVTELKKEVIELYKDVE